MANTNNPGEVTMGHFIDASTMNADLASVKGLQDAINGITSAAQKVGETIKEALKLPSHIGTLDQFFDGKKIDGAKESVKGFEEALKSVKDTAEEVGKAINAAFGNPEKEEKAKEEISGIKAVLEDLKESAKKTASSVFDSLKDAFKPEKIIEFGQEVFNTAAEYEDLEDTIKNSAINSADAEKSISTLGQQIKTMHLDAKTAYDVFGEMQTAFIGTSIKGDVLRNVFDGIGTASSALHLSPEKFKAAASSIEDIGQSATVSKDQISTLGKAIPHAMDIGAQAMGMGEQQFKNALEKGQIAGADFAIKLSKTMKNNFAKGVTEGSESLTQRTTDISNAFDELKIKIFEVAGPAILAVVKGINWVISGASSMINLLKNNARPVLQELKKDFIALAAGLGVATAAYLALNPNIVLNAIGMAADAVAEGIEAAVTGVVTAGQWLLNAALNANPLGVIVGVIGLLVAGLVAAYEHSGKFRATIAGLIAVGKDMFDIYMGVYKILWDIITLNWSKVGDDSKKLAKDITGIGSAFEDGYNRKLAEDKKKEQQDQANGQTTGATGNSTTKPDGTKPSQGVTAPPKTAPPGTTTPPTSKLLTANNKTVTNNTGNNSTVVNKNNNTNNENTKVGSKGPTTISIRIDSLIKDFKVETVNMREGALQVQEIVTRVLLAAVNDAQIVRGQ